MAIGNLQIIDIGLQNESAGSDSLYLAFNKTKNNFAILANAASQYVTFTGNTGIGVNANATLGTVDITNTGVTSLTAGSGVTISANTGNITISTTGSNGGSGTVTSVGVTSSTLTVTNSPIVGAGNIVLDLPTTGVVASQYTNPTVTVDTFGRITNIANNTVSGTVTSVSITPGTGVQVTTSGVPNVNPGFTVINTGVTRVSAGSGIQVSSGNGNVTISTTPVAAVTSVSVASTSLTVTGSPITGSGTITVDLANTISVSGNITAGNLVLTTGNIIYTPRYGSFYSNTTQTNPVANTAMAMTFNNTSSANGVSVTSNSRLTVAKAGVYNIQFSAQFTKTDAGVDYMEVWLSKNGTSVPWTNTRLRLTGSNVYEVASWNFVETLGAGEYVQLMWGSADLNAQIVAIPSANTTMGIDVPSVIVTVTPVGA